LIRKGSVDYLRPYDEANVKGVRQGDYRYKRGTTGVLTKCVRPLEVIDTTVEAMEVA
jgi:20S proteasome subunit beta 2